MTNYQPVNLGGIGIAPNGTAQGVFGLDANQNPICGTAAVENIPLRPANDRLGIISVAYRFETVRSILSASTRCSARIESTEASSELF